ncbi:MAG: type IV pilus secretin PilQ [Bdellovibrionales bacterium]|nr:type IV pilus secretin PilQ [Bdellovibrionales bacterium]
MAPEDEDASASSSPIEDDIAAAADDTSGASEDGLEDEMDDSAPAAEDQAASEPADAGGGDEDLESEFDGEPEQQQADAGEDALEGDLAGDDLESSPAPTEETVQSDPVLDEPDLAEAEPVPTPAPVIEEKAQVRDIRYMANSSGGTVVIDTTKPVSYQTRMNAATQQFVIEIAGVELPSNLQRPYLTQDFNSRVGSINAYQSAGSDTARVVIQLNGNGGSEPVVQQEGTSLVVIPPAPAAPVAQKPAPVPTAKNESALSARTLDEFLTGNQRFFGRLISLQVKDADVRDVVNFLAEESGANIVMSDDVKGRISLKLRRVPWDQALVTVMRTKELGYVRQGNVLRISTLKALQSETEAANKIIEAQKAIVPAIVQVIPVNYANLDDLVKNLTPFLSKDGKVVADSRTNTMIVTDKAEAVDRVQKLIKTLDIQPAQVSIETKIVEAAEEFSNFVGVNWGFSGADVTLSNGSGFQGAPVNLNLSGRSASLTQEFAGAGPLALNIGLGTVDVFGNLSATLLLAQKDSLAKVISSPRISTMNREKSTILQKGENVSVSTTRSEQTGAITKSEKRTPFTLELGVTPQITSDGAVIMDLEVKREFLGPIVDNETNARAVNTRQAKTKILVRNGQTAVIGGIYTNDELEARNGVPGLMNIPVLGWLFKNRSVERTKNELLIFLTPRVLAADETRAQMASAQ